MKFTLSALFLSSTFVLAEPTLIHNSDALQAKVYQLDNGLTVYLSKNSQTPRFYAEFAVRCGSRHDPPNATGMAHYLEHLMFKGSEKMGTLDFSKEKPLLDDITKLYEKHSQETDKEKRKAIYKQINDKSLLAAKYAVPNEIDRLYKLLGGTDVNAHCSLEETVYKVNLPANELERWAKIEAERFNKPVFRLFHTELETVYEEKNRSLDNGNRQLFAQLQRKLYPKHPYGETTLGREEHLKNPSIKALQAQYDKFYVPSNMALMISGDINIEKTIQIIDQHFGVWKKSEAPIHQEQAVTELEGIKRITVRFEGDEKVIMAWPTVKKHHIDSPALIVFDMILDNQVAGLINQNLVKNQKVRAAGCYPYILNEAGAQYFYASPRKGQSLADLEKLILEQIELVKEGKFADWIIPAIQQDIQIRDQESYETNLGRVQIMRDSFLSRENWNYTVQKQARLSKVTRADVIHVANKYFGPNYVVAEMVKGKPNVKLVEKPQIDPVPINSGNESAFAKSIIAQKTNSLSPQFGITPKRSMDFAGNVYYTVENPVNDLFSVTWSFPIGSKEENKLPLAFDLLEKSGTNKSSQSQLTKTWYQLGVSTSFNVSENVTNITLSGPSQSYNKAVETFENWIKNVKFEQKVLNKLIADEKLNREDLKQDPRTIVHALARHSRYGKSSVYHRKLTSDELNNLTTKELKESLHHLFYKYNRDVTYVGTLKESEWKTALTKPENTITKVQVVRSVQKTKEPIQIDFYHREMAQAQVWIESHTPEWKQNKLPYLQLFNEYFGGGMSSLVFQELREARGLAYVAYGYMAQPRIKDDAFVTIGFIGCQADKSVAAIDKFLELFDKMPQSETRFNEAKNAIINNLNSDRIEFRNQVPTLLDWQRKGYEGDPRKMIYETVEKASIEDFMKFYQDNLKGLPKRICIVGDKNRVDIEALKKLGSFRELTDKDIFVE